MVSMAQLQMMPPTRGTTPGVRDRFGPAPLLHHAQFDDLVKPPSPRGRCCSTTTQLRSHNCIDSARWRRRRSSGTSRRLQGVFALVAGPTHKARQHSRGGRVVIATVTESRGRRCSRGRRQYRGSGGGMTCPNHRRTCGRSRRVVEGVARTAEELRSGRVRRRGRYEAPAWSLSWTHPSVVTSTEKTTTHRHRECYGTLPRLNTIPPPCRSAAEL